MKKCLIFLILTGMFFGSYGQRKYANNSVLATGQWIKVATELPGIYKVTSGDLKAAGITGNISSTQIRLFGNGGGVLPEANSTEVEDDLLEIAIDMYDGGDGNFDGNDFFLFYAPGPHHWKRDSSAAGFYYQKNPYSNRAFYFIQIASVGGMRIGAKKQTTGDGVMVNMFDEHVHHELDSINFLKSGKEWYGEYFSNQAGRNASRDFNLNMLSAVNGEQFYLTSEVVGTSVNQQNKIAVSVNGKKVLEHATDPIPGSLISPVASVSNLSAKDVLTGNGLTVNYQHNGGSLNAATWLNWFSVFFKRKLDLQGLGQLPFRLKSTPVNKPIVFNISNANNSTIVWDISDLHNPQKIKTVLNGNIIRFTDSVNENNEFIAFDPLQANSPQIIGRAPNQNLHQLTASALIIVTDKSLIEQAIRLRDFHLKEDRISGMVVDVEAIFNEFSSGTPDPTAIRNFFKMLYDRAQNSGTKPKYVLLFGSASYRINEKNIQRNSLVPSYQTDESLDPLLSYVTDDYFGFLDDNEDVNNRKNIALLDVGVGRLPVRNLTQAKNTVDKIIRYKSNLSLGAWRNNMTFVADDEDYNLHVEDAELHASLIQRSAPQLMTSKIYLDAYRQESNAGGSRYPDVNKAILKDINNGTLIWNYSGHGNSTRLAYEVLLDKDLLAGWKNENRLPFFITATCDFAPFDDQSQFSIGEDLLVGRSTGAIGMVTTTRLVFASSNREMNNNFLAFLTERNTDSTYPLLGTALKEAKNFTYLNSSDFINARKFTLLGDPAMKLAMPDHIVATTSIRQEGSSKPADTLKAMNKYTVSGELRSPSGKLLSTFNGNLYPVLYDKPKTFKTMANDPESKAVDFSSYADILYKGKITVQNGQFSFTFTLPKDIDYSFGNGKLIYYADNGIIDASGVDQQFVIGGSGISTNDIAGPDMKAFLDTASFKNGDVVGSDPVLNLLLSDASGINLSDASIGHNIVAILDDRYADPIKLNEYYTATGNNSGIIRYPFQGLTEGKHRLEIKAWDVLNNSSTAVMDFVVKASKIDPIRSLTIYPNPFSESIQLSASLNLASLGYIAHLDIFSADGKILKHQEQSINQKGLFNVNYEWDGKTAQGISVQKGIYFLRLMILSKEGKNISKVLKLIKL